jgi:hypothetical protein
VLNGSVPPPMLNGAGRVQHSRFKRDGHAPEPRRADFNGR